MFNKSGGISFEPETDATILRMSVAPSPTEALDYDNWVKAVKTACGLTFGVDNLSTVFEWIYNRAAHTQQASLLNWAKNDFDSTIAGTPTFTAFRGFNGFSTSNYVTVPFENNADKTLITNTDCEFGLITDTNTNNSTTLGGQRSTNGTSYIFCGNGTSTGNRSLLLCTAAAPVAVQSTGNLEVKGLSSIRRISTTQVELYKNGAVFGPYTQNFSQFASATVWTEGFVVGTTAVSSNRISGSYLGLGSLIDNSLLYDAYKNYLTTKGVTGLP